MLLVVLFQQRRQNQTHSGWPIFRPRYVALLPNINQRLPQDAVNTVAADRYWKWESESWEVNVHRWLDEGAVVLVWNGFEDARGHYAGVKGRGRGCVLGVKQQSAVSQATDLKATLREGNDSKEAGRVGLGTQTLSNDGR